MTPQGAYALPPGRPVAYFPSLAPVVGGAKACILLCQLLYWTPRTKGSDGWIFKSQSALQHETGLTIEEQKSARTALRDRGLLDEEYKRLEHQLYFKINRESYNAIVLKVLELPPVEGEEFTSNGESHFGENGRPKRGFPPSPNGVSRRPQTGKATLVYPESTSESTSESNTCTEPLRVTVPTRFSLLLKNGGKYSVTDAILKHWKTLYPHLDMKQEFREMTGWLETNPFKRKTVRGMPRFINGWLGRSTNGYKAMSASASASSGTIDADSIIANLYHD